MKTNSLLKLASKLDSKQEYELADRLECLAFAGENTVVNTVKEKVPDMIENFIEPTVKKMTNNIGRFNIRSRSYGEPLTRIRGLAPAYAEAVQINNLRKLYPHLTQQQLVAQLTHNQTMNQQAINEAVQMMPMNQRMYENPLSWQNFNEGAWQHIPPSVKATLGLGTAALLWPTNSGPNVNQQMRVTAANQTGYRFIGKDIKTGGDWYTDGYQNWYQDPSDGQWYAYALDAFENNQGQAQYTTPAPTYDPDNPEYQPNWRGFGATMVGTGAVAGGIGYAGYRANINGTKAYDVFIDLHKQAVQALNAGDSVKAAELAKQAEGPYRQWLRLFTLDKLATNPAEIAKYQEVVKSRQQLMGALKSVKGIGSEMAELAGKTVGKAATELTKRVR